MMMLALAAAVANVPFDATARAGLPVVAAMLTAHGRTQRCEGVPLAALAARAGLASSEAVKGPALVTAIIATAADGYRVAFTLGEIDPKLGNATVLVSDRCDGKPLDAADGPVRLVVPGDTRGARSVRQLVSLVVVALP